MMSHGQCTDIVLTLMIHCCINNIIMYVCMFETLNWNKFHAQRYHTIVAVVTQIEMMRWHIHTHTHIIIIRVGHWWASHQILVRKITKNLNTPHSNLSWLNSYQFLDKCFIANLLLLCLVFILFIYLYNKWSMKFGGFETNKKWNGREKRRKETSVQYKYVNKHWTFNARRRLVIWFFLSVFILFPSSTKQKKNYRYVLVKFYMRYMLFNW